MSATESTYAPYLDRKSKVATASICTCLLTVLVALTLLLGLFAGALVLGPLVPSSPSEYAYIMSAHHVLPTWGTWGLVYFLSTNVVLVLASWLSLAFLAIDTFNVAMGIYRFIYADTASSTFITQIVVFVILLVYWLITAFAATWVWRILRFKAKRRRTYLNDEVELLSGHRRRSMIPAAKSLVLRGRPSPKHAPRTKKYPSKML